MRFGRAFKLVLGVTAIATVMGCGHTATRPTAVGSIDVFHADSLAGPMKAIKGAFEAKNPGVRVNLVSGRSQELAEQILAGTACDVFAPSAPAAIDKVLVGKKIKGTAKDAAAWSVVFSANEMVLVTAKGNPKGIQKMSDLAKDGIRFTRVTGEKDMATRRSVDLVKNITALEGKPELADRIVAKAAVDPAKPQTVPVTVQAVTSGKADAAIVYFSAAVAEREKLEILRFPATANLSKEIRNAATVPGTAKNPAAGLIFVQFLLTGEGKSLLEANGQPPVVPPILSGSVPAELK